MSTKITISKPDLNIVKGTAAKSGKPYELRIQTGYLHAIDRDGVVSEFPEKFEFILEDNAPAYPRGVYTLAPNALYVGRDGRLSVATRLLPLAPAK